MIRLTVYSREGCHLCELLIEELLPLARGRAQVEIVDVDSDPQLSEAYGLKVPVLVADGLELCHFRLDRSALQQVLADSQN